AERARDAGAGPAGAGGGRRRRQPGEEGDVRVGVAAGGAAGGGEAGGDDERQRGDEGEPQRDQRAVRDGRGGPIGEARRGATGGVLGGGVLHERQVAPATEGGVGRVVEIGGEHGAAR